MSNPSLPSFLDNLMDDGQYIWKEFYSWGADRLEDLKRLPDFMTSGEGGAWFFRLLLAIALFVAVILLRKRIGSLVTPAVRRLGHLRFFQGRIGPLIGWAGFVQAVLPALAFIVAGYTSLALVGFSYPEIRFIEVPFRWATFYLLGRQALLGLTRQVARGRPALLRVAPATVRLLRVTYGRLGLVMALAGTVAECSRLWLGTGTLSLLVRWIAWIWLLGWAVWAMFGWRQTLSQALSARTKEGSRARRAADFMSAKKTGALLSPLAFSYVLLAWIAGGIYRLLVKGGLFTWMRARSLRKMSRRAAEKTAGEAPQQLPERYLKEFPLYPILGDEGAVLLPREDLLKVTIEQIESWKGTTREGSLVMVGEKGAGKTTLLALLGRRIKGLSVVDHTLPRKLITEKGLLEELAPALGLEQAANTGALAAYLNKGDERVVMLDEAHNLFLRTVGGYEAFEALVQLVTYTSERVFWIIAFNRFAWNFINHSRRKMHYFRKLLRLPDWSIEELQDLIARRNKRAGMTVRFSDSLLDKERSTTGDLELLEGADGYFRLLRNASGGNTRVATYLWLNSLRSVSDDELRVDLFREEPIEPLMNLDDELLYALAAVCQHENLSVDELRKVLNVPVDFAGFAVRFLSEYGYLEPKHNDSRRVTLAPGYYRQVIQVLRDRHLLFEED
ncbi:MAG TPA: ATP-binding protein [Myxococcota bacterium]|nr:ATP-binding protein [Myxococcota bacterium]